MIVDMLKILNTAGKNAVSKIRQNMSKTGTDATKRTSKSLNFTVTKKNGMDALQLNGRPYFMTVETGRKPTPKYKPSKEFVKSIREWLAARGIEQGIAYAVALTIHRKGTKLWRKGGRKDIVTPVNQSMVEEINTAVLESFARAYVEEIKKLEE